MHHWRTTLCTGNPEERAVAAENLSYLGTGADFATVELLKACADDEPIREWAVAALEEIGCPPLAFKSQISALTGDPNPLTSYWAVTLLGRMGDAANSEQDALLKLLRDDSTDLAVREKSIWAIGQMGPAASGTLPVLAELLKTSDAPRLVQLAQDAIEHLQAS